MRFRRLLPDPAEVELAALLETVDLGARAPAGRPYVVVNFVASADGRAAFQGKSGTLADEGDREVFHGLRTLVDAVLVGTGTLRVESYGRLARQPARRAQRAARGLAPDPLAVVVTRSGDLPTGAPLLDDPSSTLIAYTGVPVATPDVAARVEVVELDPLTPAGALAHLRQAHGVSSVLCEGGPTLTSALLADGVVDELFLTLSPRLVGGGAEPTVTVGAPLAGLAELELVWALERASFLFLRYRVRRPSSST
jgi:riboflavin-specific deaminase-like protein